MGQQRKVCTNCKHLKGIRIKGEGIVVACRICMKPHKVASKKLIEILLTATKNMSKTIHPIRIKNFKNKCKLSGLTNKVETSGIQPKVCEQLTKQALYLLKIQGLKQALTEQLQADFDLVLKDNCI